MPRLILFADPTTPLSHLLIEAVLRAVARHPELAVAGILF